MQNAKRKMQNNLSMMSLVVLCFLICKAFFFTSFSSFHTFMCNVENFSALWKEMLKIRKSISCLCLQILSKCCGCKFLHFTFLGDVFRCDFALYIIVYKLKAEPLSMKPQSCSGFSLKLLFFVRFCSFRFNRHNQIHSVCHADEHNEGTRTYSLPQGQCSFI